MHFITTHTTAPCYLLYNGVELGKSAPDSTLLPLGALSLEGTIEGTIKTRLHHDRQLPQRVDLVLPYPARDLTQKVPPKKVSKGGDDQPMLPPPPDEGTLLRQCQDKEEKKDNSGVFLEGEEVHLTE